MSNYGDIATAWFDVPMTLSEAQSQTIYDTVRELQPNCLINSPFRQWQIRLRFPRRQRDPENKEDMNKTDVDYNEITGFKPSPLGLYETAGTINDSWGFSYHDQDGKHPVPLPLQSNTSTILASITC